MAEIDFSIGEHGCHRNAYPINTQIETEVGTPEYRHGNAVAVAGTGGSVVETKPAGNCKWFLLRNVFNILGGGNAVHQ